MTSDIRTEYLNLGKRPDLMLKLERYGIVPTGIPEGPYTGYAKGLSDKGKQPYDEPVYQEMVDRLPDGWENVSPQQLYAWIETLNNQVADKKNESLSTERLGDRVLLEQFLKIALLAIFIGAAAIEKSHFAWMPKKEDSELKEAEQFSYVLLLQIALKSNVMRQTLQVMGSAAGVNEKQQHDIAEIIQLFGILVAIKIASMKNIDYGIVLFEEFRDTLLHGIIEVQAILSDAEQQEKLAGPIPNGVSLFLQQAKIALEKGDFEGFYETYTQSLELLGITDEQFTQDLEGIRQLADRLIYAFTEGRNDQTNTATGITQA